MLSVILNGCNLCTIQPVQCHYFQLFFFGRAEPLCVTCDLGDVLWTSRYYYINCSHFDAFVSPLSSIATEIGVDYYILECLGPGLPLSGKFIFHTFSIDWILF